MPPTPSSGRMATARTMIPMPPSHWSSWRQRLMEGARVSSPIITVAPVVVSPDMVSKKASVKDICWCSISGTVAMAAVRVQARVTRMKPSLALSSARWRRVTSMSRPPAAMQASMLAKKVTRVPSP